MVVELPIKSFDKALSVATYKKSAQTRIQKKGIIPNTDKLGKSTE